MDTTQREVSSSLGVAPTPEYLCQTRHVISPAPLLQLANLSHGIGLTTASPIQSTPPVKTKAARKQSPPSERVPQKKKSNEIAKKKDVVKRKKGGGLKVKIQFPSVSKEIKEISSTSKETASSHVFSNEAAASTTTTLQMSPAESTSPPTTGPAGSTSCHLSSLSGSSSGGSSPLQGEGNYPQGQAEAHTDSSESDEGN